MKKLTFPHMGNMYMPVKVLFDELGADYVIPPSNSREVLELGARYCPETVCMPFKFNLGNILQAMELGADTVIMTGGCGPCRFGRYGSMLQRILADLGHYPEMIIMEAPGGDVRELVRRILAVAGDAGAGMPGLIRALHKAIQAAAVADRIQALAARCRAHETRKGSADAVYAAFEKDVLQSAGWKGFRICAERAEDALSQIQQNNSQEDGHADIKVGLIGEIYTIIDDDRGLRIVQQLGAMGIEAVPALTVSLWAQEHMVRPLFPLFAGMKAYHREAKPYLGAMIGGHARETLGSAVHFAKSGFDGLVQTYPLTCMPEIAAQGILPAIHKDYDIPVLTLISDEMSGSAGVQTRLEAFAELLSARKFRGSDWRGEKQRIV